MKGMGTILRPLLAAVLLAGCTLQVDAAVQPGQRVDGQGEWSKAKRMSVYRSEHAVAALDGRIYVAGGLAGPNNNFTGVTNSFESYDPAANTWRSEPYVPDNLHHMGIAALDGRIYITGGYTGSDFTVDNNNVWVFTPSSPRMTRWSSAAGMPANRAAHASVALGGLIYVVGGVGPGSTALWAYNAATNSWDTSRAPLPTPREHLAAVALNGKLYVIGGRWSGVGNLGTLEEYDPATNLWTQRPIMPTPRGGLTASVVNGRIHVTAGEDLGTLKTYAEHEIYDPATNSWAAYPAMPTARHGLGSASVNGHWYVIGGGTLAGGGTYSSLTNIVEVFTPASMK